MQNVEWDGNGVPSIGCKIFVCATADQLGSRLCDFAEKEVNVISHFYHEGDAGVVISHPIMGVGAFLFFKGNKTFRPIKSEREKAIDEIHAVIDSRLESVLDTVIAGKRQIAEALYDAGLRFKD